LFLIEGEVWASGSNNIFQIGDGSTQPHFKPIQIKIPKTKKISAWNTSGALTEAGELYVWGQDFKVPTKYNREIYSDIAVGGSFTVLTDQQGRLMLWNKSEEP
jgi:alpha-tubulin suppressor-like RCC1 family protein